MPDGGLTAMLGALGIGAGTAGTAGAGALGGSAALGGLGASAGPIAAAGGGMTLGSTAATGGAGLAAAGGAGAMGQAIMTGARSSAQATPIWQQAPSIAGRSPMAGTADIGASHTEGILNALSGPPVDAKSLREKGAGFWDDFKKAATGESARKFAVGAAPWALKELDEAGDRGAAGRGIEISGRSPGVPPVGETPRLFGEGAAIIAQILRGGGNRAARI